MGVCSIASVGTDTKKTEQKMSDRNKLAVPGAGSDLSPSRQEGEQSEQRRSSLVTVKKPVRKNSFVSFDENRATIGTQDASEEVEHKDKDNISTLEATQKAKDEEDDIFSDSKRWTDSLKINRRKSREGKDKMMKTNLD